jgi:hypothetical protein
MNTIRSSDKVSDEAGESSFKESLQQAYD